MSEEYWSIEGHDRSGQTFLHLPHVTPQEVATLMAAALADPRTGGLVIYRPPRPTGKSRVAAVAAALEYMKEGDEQRLGLVTDESPCTYCTVRGDHAADCPVIS